MYHPNSIEKGEPRLAAPAEGFVPFAERLEGFKTRARSESFSDHFSQATLFYRSLTEAEQRHLLQAFAFEVGKVERPEIRKRVVDVFAQVDGGLAAAIASRIGVEPPARRKDARDDARGRPARGTGKAVVDSSPALSIERSPKPSIATRRVAVLVADGVSTGDVSSIEARMLQGKATVELIAAALGTVKPVDGSPLEVAATFLTAASVCYDAVVVPGGRESVDALSRDANVRRFLDEAFRHSKTIGALGEAVDLVRSVVDAHASDAKERPDPAAIGVVLSEGGEDDGFADRFEVALRQHRHFERERLLPPV
jgi:catalase